MLRDKIPEPIRPLCVQALSNDVKGMQDLEFSVKGITDRHLTYDFEESRREMDRLEKDLASARKRRQEAIHDQRASREEEVLRREGIGGVYSGTLADIARTLNSESEQLGFIEDVVSRDEVPPVSADEFRTMLSILAQSDTEANPVEIEPPLLNSLPHPDVVDDLAEDIQRLSQLAATNGDPGQVRLVQRLRQLTSQTRDALFDDTQRIVERLEHLQRRRTEAWLNTAVVDVFTNRERPWRSRLQDSQSAIERLQQIPREVLDARIGGLEGLDPDVVYHHAAVLHRHFEARPGKGLGFTLLLPRDVRSVDCTQ